VAVGLGFLSPAVYLFPLNMLLDVRALGEMFFVVALLSLPIAVLMCGSIGLYINWTAGRGAWLYWLAAGGTMLAALASLPACDLILDHLDGRW